MSIRRLTVIVYVITLAVIGMQIGWHGAKYYRAKTAKCKPCEDAKATAAPGMGVSNP